MRNTCKLFRLLLISLSFVVALTGWISNNFNQDKVHVKSSRSKSFFAEEAVRRLGFALLNMNTTSHFGERKATRKDRYTRLINQEKNKYGRREYQSFQIKEYRPEVFRTIRENAGIKEEHYLEALLPENMQFLSNQMDSKSKQFFWKSFDEELVVKTMKAYECRTMKKISHIYKQHLLHEDSSFSARTGDCYDLRTSCLGNVLGCYRVTFYNRFGLVISRYYIMINKNIFSSHQPDLQRITFSQYHSRQYESLTLSRLFATSQAAINTTQTIRYDLKGSLIGRKKSFSSLVFKDLDLISQNKRLFLSKQGNRLLLETLQYDTFFLQNLNLMDYSLLVQVEKFPSHVFSSPLLFVRRFMVGHSSQPPVSRLLRDR